MYAFEIFWIKIQEYEIEQKMLTEIYFKLTVGWSWEMAKNLAHSWEMGENLADDGDSTPSSWPSVEADIRVNWRPEFTNYAPPAQKWFKTQKH